MTDTEIMIAKRITQAAGALLLNTSSHDDTLRLQGLCLALAFCFEEMMGLSAKSRKPSELMTWAYELPEPLIKRVEVIQ